MSRQNIQYKTIKADKCKLTLHEDLKGYVSHIITDKRRPRSFKNRPDTVRDFLEVHPIYVTYSGKLPYQVYGGLLSYLIFQFLPQECLSNINIHLIIMKEELVNVRSSFAASLMEARILGNSQIVDGYKCPIENSLVSMLSDKWPEANSVHQDTNDPLVKDLMKCGFLKPTNEEEEIELNVINDIMKIHDA